MTPIQNRYDFVFLFDIKNGNPNGDPDNGNMPRIDNDTQKGLVTDVALKRKIRNYVDLKHGGKPPFGIYMREKAVLNTTHAEAYTALGIKSDAKKLPKEDEGRKITRWMCDNFYDIRTFGAVMTTEVNAGQVRGPVQLIVGIALEGVGQLAEQILKRPLVGAFDIGPQGVAQCGAGHREAVKLIVGRAIVIHEDRIDGPAVDILHTVDRGHGKAGPGDHEAQAKAVGHHDFRGGRRGDRRHVHVGNRVERTADAVIAEFKQVECWHQIPQIQICAAARVNAYRAAPCALARRKSGRSS